MLKPEERLVNPQTGSYYKESVDTFELDKSSKEENEVKNDEDLASSKLSLAKLGEEITAKEAAEKNPPKKEEVPKPERIFPSTNMVYHFHAIAFVNHLKKIYGGAPSGECPELVWGKKVSYEFRKRVVQISKRLECDPNHLMTAMALETGGKFSPSIDNGLAKDADGIGYVGLIQFGNDAVTDLNKNYFLYKAKIKKKNLKNMTAEDQLCYVESFLSRHKGKLKTLADFYLAILLPADVGKGNQKDHVVFDSSLTLNHYANGKVKKDINWVRKNGYKANPTFFKEIKDKKSNENGKTYVWEIAEAIQEWYDKGVPYTNNSNDCPTCSCEEKCIDLTSKVTWISQFNKSEWKAKRNEKGEKVMKTDGCWRTSQKLLMSAGLSKTSGYKSGMIITALEDNEHTKLTLTAKAKEGVDYINDQLHKGNPVLVGLNHTVLVGCIMDNM